MDEKSLKHDLDALANRDPVVAEGLALVGYPAPRTGVHGFPTLLSIIISQQISKEAAGSIKGRVEALAPGLDVEAVAALSDEALRGAGLSRPKVAYVRSLVDSIHSGALNVDALPDLDDAAVIKAITALKGFGVWSAEIYCMFSLDRPDVFPAGDLALQEAVRRLKGLETRPSDKQTRTLVADWSPWRTAAAVFCWHYYRGAPQTG